MVLYYENYFWEEKAAYFSTFTHPKNNEEYLVLVFPAIGGVMNLGKVYGLSRTAQNNRYEIEKAIERNNYVDFSRLTNIEYISNKELMTGLRAFRRDFRERIIQDQREE